MTHSSCQCGICFDKMKKFLTLCVVLVARSHAEFVSPFPKEYDQFVDACRMETGYTDEVVAKEQEGYFSENKGLRIFNYCFLDKTGFMVRDGNLNIDYALAKLGVHSLLKDLVENCNNRKKKDLESVFAKCFHRGVSTYMRLSEFTSVIRAVAKNFTQFVDTCRKETGYTDEVIAEEEKDEEEEGAGFKKFNNCFLDKTDFTNYEKFSMNTVLKKMPESNVMEIIEFCQSKRLEKIIPDSFPYFSACFLLRVSGYVRTTKLRTVPSGENNLVHEIVDACNTETGFRDELSVFVVGRNFTKLKGLRKFNDCFLEKTGFITSDGKLNIDGALANLEAHFAKLIVEHCQANVILKYIKESVHDFSTCYHHGVQNEIKSKFGFTNYWQFGVPGTFFAKKNVFVTAYIDDDFDRLLSKWAGLEFIDL